MKQFIIVLSLLILGFRASTQENLPKLKIGGFAGYATYLFKNLENANKEVISQLPFDAEVIDNFPARMYFGGFVLLRITNWYSAGPVYEFHSTGSRIGAKDYSGSYHFDQVMSTNQLGIENEILISKANTSAFYLDFTGGVNFSSWAMEEELKIDNELLNPDNSEFTGIKPFVYPALKFSCREVKGWNVFAKAGYIFDLGGKYHLSGNNEYQSTQKIPWSGFRVSLGLEWEIN